MRRPIGSERFTWIEVVVILVVLGFVFVILSPGYRRERRTSLMVACHDQLSNIGKAMLSYANDYDRALPQAGGKGTKWGPRLRNWSASSQSEAFGLDPNLAGGEATISASLYLLVRHRGIGPKSFICRADKRVTECRPRKYGVASVVFDSDATLSSQLLVRYLLAGTVRIGACRPTVIAAISRTLH